MKLLRFMQLGVLVTLIGWLIPSYAENLNVTISPGDLLKISVYQNDDLDIQTQVSPAGTVTFPLVGEVLIEKLTVRQAEQLIGRELVVQGFLKTAQVNIVILESKAQQVSVLGQVNRPGKYPLNSGSSKILDFLSLAGGISNNGSKKVILLKKEKETYQRYILDMDYLIRFSDLSEIDDINMTLTKGDLLYVPKEAVFYIYGSVGRPGSYPLPERLTLVQALSIGGGVTQRGDYDRVKIKRRKPTGEVVTLLAADDAIILENDVIFVEESLF